MVGSAEDGYDSVVSYLDTITEPITRPVLGTEFLVFPGVFDPVFQDSQFLAIHVPLVLSATDRVLDMGTGCGVQAVFASRVAVEIVAVDVNPYAVQCAIENVRRLGIQNVEAWTSDLFSALADEKFNVIIWNPPMYDRVPKTWAEVACGDPGHGLLQRFFGEARGHLTEDGSLILVISDSIGLHTFRRLAEAAGLRHEVLTSMYNEKNYYICVLRY